MFLIFVIVVIAYGWSHSLNGMLIASYLLISLRRMLIGYVLAVSGGLITAVIISSHKYISYTFMPILNFMMSIPTIAWVPLLLVLSGINETTIIIAIFLGAYFTITYNTIEGFNKVPKRLLQVGEVLEYSTFQMFYRIKIPASFNHMLVGLKLGIAYSWRALIGAEMLGAAEQGIGFLLFASRKFYNIPQMLVSLALIGSMGYLLSKVIVHFIENRTVKRWGLDED